MQHSPGRGFQDRDAEVLANVRNPISPKLNLKQLLDVTRHYILRYSVYKHIHPAHNPKLSPNPKP